MMMISCITRIFDTIDGDVGDVDDDDDDNGIIPY